MTTEEMKEKKRRYGLTAEMISKASGVPLGTVQKIFSGTTKVPRKLTMDAIEKVFREEEAKRNGLFAGLNAPGSILREESGRYGAAKRQELHTLDDYYALPEDIRAELIDGTFYNMGAPTRRHQLILGEMYLQLKRCAQEHEMPCEIYLSPCDVRLDRDDYTMVQPDLLAVCNYENPDMRRIEGAPDFVVEILSQATRMKDLILKLRKYQNAGVREYWIVDPQKRRVTVHCFEDEDYSPENYDFRGSVPVAISKGRCQVDFSGILDQLQRHGW